MLTSDKILKQLWDTSIVGLRITDKDGIIIDANDAYARMFRKSKSEIVGKPFSICYEESIREKTLRRYNERFANLVIPEELQRKIKLWDGSEIWVELNNSIIFNEQNEKLIASIFRDITSEKIAQEKILEISNKNEAILKTSLEGIHVLDLNGNFIECNQAFLEHLGYSLDELQKMNVVDWDVAFSREELLSIIDELRFKSRTFETRHRRKDGEIRDVEISANGCEINEKSYIFCSCRDITERKKSEEILRESEERFKNIFLDSPVITLIIHPETGKIIDVNPAAVSFYGYSREEFINKIYSYDLNVSSKQDEFRDLWLAKSKKRNQYLLQHKLKGGSIRFVEISSGPITIRGKKLIISIVNDVTQKKLVEENLRTFSMVVEQSPVSVVITDTNGIIQYVNSFFTKITGYEAKEAIGKKTNIVKSGFMSQSFYEELWSTITAGKNWIGEILNKKKNGDLHWEKAIIAPLTDAKGQIVNFVGIKEEITDRKKMIEELRLAKDEAEKSDKLKSEFLAQISHEIRTPINVIVNFINLLKLEFAGYNLSDDVKTAYQSIDSATKRIIRTVDLILNMSELQVGAYIPQMRYIDIEQDILKNLYIDFLHAAELKNIKLSIERFTDNLNVFVDEYSVTQIFSNLLDNAIKYTNEGSVKIVIERDNDDRLIISVVDTGIGISEEFIPNLFRPFSQEEQGYTRRFEGNGLGLALVKKYCDLNNAEIKVISEKGKGSTFSVIFN